MPAMHFGGGLRIRTARRMRIWLAGWPCCVSGRRALLMPPEQLTNKAAEVTCKACLAQMKQDVDAGWRFPADGVEMIDQYNDSRTGWARFSDDMTMRYRLARVLTGDASIEVDVDGSVGWDFVGPPRGMPVRCVFLLLNPSDADAFKPDPTVGECIKRARQLGAHILEVVNLFAFRSPYPSDLKKCAHGYRGDTHLNDGEIIAACIGAHWVIAGWGNDGALDHRNRVVMQKLARVGIELHHLGLTKEGHPKHPLARGKHRIPADLQPVRWTP